MIGEFAVTMCPQDYVTPDIWQAIEMSELMRKGCPPVNGGTLDQTQIFLDACRFIWSEENAERARSRSGLMSLMMEF